MSEQSERVAGEIEASEDDKATLASVINMSDMDYDRNRIKIAKKLGCRVVTLDKHRKNGGDKAEETSCLYLSEAEPCANPVNGAELLDEIVAFIKDYLVLPEGAARATALWVIHTYSYDAEWISPLLFVTSPTKRCGKSTLVNMLLGSIVNKPLIASNCTSATLFRGIEKYSPTLLLDEAETFMKDNEEMRGILNSGHSRASAQILRAVASGDDYDVKPFSTWCPKAIAAIGKLADTLMDRSITISIQRKKKADRVKRWRGDKAHEFEPIRSRCARWVLDNFNAIQENDPTVPDRLGDREADNWRPLLSIAEVAGWTEAAKAAIEELVPKKTDDDDTGIKLLSDIREILIGTTKSPKSHQYMASADIVMKLNEIEESPWPGFFGGKGINPQRLAKMLGNYKIKPKVHRQLGQKRGYETEHFLEVWTRYLPDPSEEDESGDTPSQTSNDGASRDLLDVTGNPGVTPEKTLQPAPIKGRSTVTPICPDMAEPGARTIENRPGDNDEVQF